MEEGPIIYNSVLFYFIIYIQFKGGCLLFSIILYSLKGRHVTVLFYSIVPCEEKACHSSIQLYKGLQSLKGGVCHCSFSVFTGGLPHSILFYSTIYYSILCYSMIFYSVLLYSIILRRAVSRFCSTLQRGAYFKARGITAHMSSLWRGVYSL